MSAARAAADIRAHLQVPRTKSVAPAGGAAVDTDSADVERLRKTMARDVGVVRQAEGLAAAVETIGALRARARSPRLQNMTAAALLIATAALARTEESRRPLSLRLSQRR